MLKIIEEGNEIRAPDPDRQANVLLLQARVLFDDGEHAVLHRTDVEPGKGSQEVTKYGELGLSKSIPDEVGEMAEVDGFGRRIRKALRSLSPSSFLCHQPLGLPHELSLIS
jgi:hypothetical protein